MKKIHWLAAVAVGLVVGGMAFRATGQERAGSTQEEKATVIGFVRTINTAEVVYKMAGDGGGGPRGRYGSWADLHSSGATEKYLQECPMAREDWSRQGIDDKGIRGYRVDLIVSPDGQSYSLAVHDQQEGHGLFSVFSDQMGIIYLGEPLQ
jgi:hypothetical protein